MKMMSIKGKKIGQTEVVGMLMIVVIISFLLLFVFKAIFFDGGGIGVGDVKKENQATSAINALLKTSSTCTPDTDFRELIIDCTKDWMSRNGGSGELSEITCRDGTDTCEFAQREIANIFDDTFTEWGVPYEFIVRPPQPTGREISDLAINTVTAAQQAALREQQSGAKSATQPLPIGFGYGALEIELCLNGECA